MQRLGRKRIINLIFFLALTAMVGCSILSYQLIQTQWNSNRWVIHSYRVIEAANQVLFGLIEAERQEQSFLNSGTQEYLLAYQAGVSDVRLGLSKMKQLTVDNPLQQNRIAKLQPEIETTIHSLATIAKGYQSSRKEQSISTILSVEEQASINNIKTQLLDFKYEERMILEKRNDIALQDGMRTNLLMIVTACLSAIFLILSYLLLTIQEQNYIRDQMRINRELERQNKLAQEATRLKSEFLANMSHELRTPLNAVIGFSELMQDGEGGPVTKLQHEFLTDILSSAKHLLRLINDVLDLSKVEAGRMDFHPEVINLRNLVEEVEEILQPMITQKKINFASLVDADLSIAYLDPGRLKQVIYNYLTNALKFTPELGSVQIHIKPDSSTTLRIEVEDNGIGIKPADMKRLFVEFEQLDASATKKYPGTGLGLALTKRIVEAQGGEVGVTSILGKGSIFFATLPLTQKMDLPADAIPETTNVIPTIRAKKRIQNVLVIEDNQNDLEWIANILTLHGYAIETAQNGKSAIEYANNQIFDLITLDLMLPDINGYEVLRHIRQSINLNTPVVVITAATDRGQSMGFLVSDYLVKPVNKEQLMTALYQVGIMPNKGHKVLVVDDDPNALKLVTYLLDGEGFELTCAIDPKQGLVIAGELNPDVIVLDLLMPGISGFEFLRYLHQRGIATNVPIIVWTAKDLTQEERDFLESSVQGIVLKSIADSTEELLRAIKNLTQHSDSKG
jgi:signal transduction histidine kinase/CheY-like chemotaxis protein